MTARRRKEGAAKFPEVPILSFESHLFTLFVVGITIFILKACDRDFDTHGFHVDLQSKASGKVQMRLPAC